MRGIFTGFFGLGSNLVVIFHLFNVCVLVLLRQFRVDFVDRLQVGPAADAHQGIGHPA